ncbi:hypothetical protein [Listonella phage phiHSIC]|uniref:hypothetical protein n=1 Tax=Listonella phage phiHSIC TaxID=310539 RepID=UPI00004C7419|nr:hypothetical protein LPPPVgp30 [Listonella phage phiHSIC]AAW67529.1 hypothetical protein [Listonella phage phiHSIC]
MSLKVVDPIEVTEAVLTASGIPEPDVSQGEVEYNPNKTEGIKFTNVTWDITDIARDGGTIYALDEYPFSPSGASLVRTYDVFGNETAIAFSTQNDAKCIDVYLGSIYVGDSNGFVNKYNTSGTLLETFDLTANVSRVDAICGSYGPFYILDQTTGKVFEFGTLNDLTPFEVRDFGTFGSFIFGFTHRNGIIYYTNQNNGKIESMSAGTGEARDSFALTNDRDGVYYLGGLAFLADGSLLSVNTTGSEAFKYVNGSLKQPYNPGDQVVVLSNHTKYQCLVATSQSPIDGATEDATATWIKVGPTNKWAMFDNLQNTKTLNDTDFTITLNPTTYVNTLAALGFSGVTSIRVEVDNVGGTTIYDKTFGTSDFSAIYDHYTYVFYQIVALQKLIVDDLPPLPDTEIRVTFSGSDIQIGELAHGFAINVGTLVAESTKSDRFRYREQQYNEFGYPVGAEPIVVELNTYDVLVPKLNNPAIQKLLDRLTGKNTLWVGDIGGGQGLITYGFFERSPIPFSMPYDINYQITVRASV